MYLAFAKHLIVYNTINIVKPLFYAMIVFINFDFIYSIVYSCLAIVT